MKERLVTYVQQDPTNFKVYRIYSNNQEYEMSRLNDQLTTVPNDTRLVVRLGRALQPGEVRVRLSLLRMDQTEVLSHPHSLKLTFLFSYTHTTHFHCYSSCLIPIHPFPIFHSSVFQTTDGFYCYKGYDYT